MKKKAQTLCILALRICLEGYNVFRVVNLFSEADPDDAAKIRFQNRFLIGRVGIIATTACDGIILVLIVVYTFRCISCFGKGMKEIKEKQKKVNENDQEKLREPLYDV